MLLDAMHGQIDLYFMNKMAPKLTKYKQPSQSLQSLLLLLLLFTYYPRAQRPPLLGAEVILFPWRAVTVPCSGTPPHSASGTSLGLKKSWWVRGSGDQNLDTIKSTLKPFL